MTATNHDGHKVYHDSHSNENVKTNGLLLRNCQIHDMLDKFHQVMSLVIMVCGHHGCGHHGYRLWPLWFVAVMVVAVIVGGVAVALVAGGQQRYLL